jgi:hypothetical protein
MSDLTPIREIPAGWHRLEAAPPTGLGTARRIAERWRPIGKWAKTRRVFILALSCDYPARYQAVKCERREGADESVAAQTRFHKAKLDTPPEA